MYRRATTFSKSILLNPLFGGSAVMIVGSNLANFFAYIYHFILGRMLGKSMYGELVAFLSLLAILSATYSFVNLVIVKYVSGTDKKGQRELYAWFNRLIIKFGVPATLLVFLLTPVFKNILHMDYSIVIFAAPIFFLGFVAYIYRSFLQGLLKFSKNVFLVNIELFGRLAFGLLLVIIGLGVFGAVVGILIALAVSVFMGRHYLKEYVIKSTDGVFMPDKKVLTYSLTILINTIAVTSIISIDILLVRHYFSAADAGTYAAVSTLGKTILFATLPISAVMFPIISGKYAKGQKYLKIFWGSLLMTLSVAGIILVLFLFLPSLAINILYGVEYIQASSYLFAYGIFITIFSINSLFLNYFLSIEKTKIVFLSAAVAITQLLGIIIYHDSLNAVIHVSTISAILMLAGLLVYFAHEIKVAKAKTS
jgi:O-antigen/teichoic acid export membrane protein